MDSPLRSDGPRYRTLAVPLVLMAWIQPVMGMIDLAFAGHFGTASTLAGLSVGTAVLNTVLWLLSGLRLHALAKGSAWDPRREAVPVHLVSGMVTALIGGALLSLTAPLWLRLFEILIRPSQAVWGPGAVYAGILLRAAPVYTVQLVVHGWLTGTGRVKALGRLLLLNGASNAAANGLLLGLMEDPAAALALGSAVSTALAVLAGLLILGQTMAPLRTVPSMGSVMRGAVESLPFHRDLMLRTGFIAIQNTLFARISNSGPPEAVAANALLLQLTLFMAYGMEGLSAANGALAGRLLRSGRQPVIRSLPEAAAGLLTYAVLGALAMGAASPAVLKMMTSDPLVGDTALKLRWLLVGYPFFAAPGLGLAGVAMVRGRTAVIRDSSLTALLVFAACSAALPPLWGNRGLWLSYLFSYGARSLHLCLGLHHKK